MPETVQNIEAVVERGVRPRTIPLNHGWLFGGKAVEGSTQSEFDDSSFEQITLPHSNETFSWHNFDRSEYQYISIYRRHFSLPQSLQDQRVFIDFEGAMTASTVTINGKRLGEYKGGYTPFSFELTSHLNWDEDNVLAVEVDSRRTRHDIPPFGDGMIDLDTFGGIYRSASLRVVPETFIDNVFAKPVNVLDDDERRLNVTCHLNSMAESNSPLQVEVELRDDDKPLARVSTEAFSSNGTVELDMDGLEEIELWNVDNPKLYDVKVYLRGEGKPVDEYDTRIGFREAKFEPDGFYLNGSRLKIFGLNRHELFPYVGPAMPPRVQRRDAEILKNELNCNMVRTSHYVQSPAFMDACDELGLLVWDEIPGWHNIGDESWQDVAAEHTEKMIKRDWNHPSVVLWAPMINERVTETLEFEERLDDLAHELDDSRQTTGAYTGRGKRRNPLVQDVRGRNDYDYPNGDDTFPIRPLNYVEPYHHEPYLVPEAVGQKEPGGPFEEYYRRTEPGPRQHAQAKRHAHAHNIGASDDRYAGIIAWCAFEYNSPKNAPGEVKTPGVVDLFRIPKLGANFYRSQVDPEEEVVLEPAFYWDFGPDSPENGPGEDAMICSNCERLEIYVDDEHYATQEPALESFPYLQYPPFLVDLTADGSTEPELRIDGFIDDHKVVSRSFSADTEDDRLSLEADDNKIVGDGIDMTRVVFRAVDKYGAPRPFVEGDVELKLEGPGEIVGDSSFDFEDAGGAGAVWVRTSAGESGEVRIHAEHPTLGEQKTEIQVMEALRSELEVL